MSLDREKTLKNAERLLKQGKIQPALHDCQRVAASAPKDLALQNRIGDLLARHGRNDEAVLYYQRTAEKFGASGFFPKAIAVCKKILRLTPDRPEVLVRIGNLYLQQRLPGEARSYLLLGAERFLDAKEFARAREVFESLAEAEPDDPRHRVRVAETLAAEGENEQAGQELLQLAESLDPSEHTEHREAVFRRAVELLPGRAEPVAGLVESLVRRDAFDDALVFLEERLESLGDVPSLIAERAVLLDRVERHTEALDAMAAAPLEQLAPDCLTRFFRNRVASGTAQEAWDRLGPGFDEWAAGESAPRLVGVLEEIADLEQPAHVPALDRMAKVLEFRKDTSAATVALERLVTALGPGTDTAARTAAENRLRAVAPESSVLASDDPAVSVSDSPPDAASVDASPAPAPAAVAAEAEPETAADELPVEAEAPAVPLTRADEEFVSGRLTQVEILEKYGLQDKALEQLLEVIERFPGHVATQERRLQHLEDHGGAAGVKDALLGLALACRAAGDLDKARDAVRRAQRRGPLDEGLRTTLTRLRLLDQTAPPEPEPTTTESHPPTATPDSPATESPSPAAVAEAPATATAGGEIVIDFDAEADADAGDDDRSTVETPDPVSQPAVAEEAGQDPVSDEPLPEPEVAEVAAVEAAAEEDGQAATRVEDLSDDLSELTAALESELFVDDLTPVPEAGQEQSLEEVFEAFKKHVDEEVGRDDHQTHYDLGIAYKEMGLLDEAIEEFKVALESESLGRQACIMIAMCCRDRDRIDEAIEWYRRALDTPNHNGDAANGLRYDLAEVLLQTGDAGAALEMFRNVLADDPTYRDVQTRVQKIESESGA